ncbi:AAA family ATPase [bacterium]|nr:AAA family ATPase [bacterium]
MVSSHSVVSVQTNREPLFIGREAEIAELGAALARAAAGCGQVVLIGGEAGIGKTALVARATRELRPGDEGSAPLLLWGRCWEGDGAPPFWPWSHALRHYIVDRDLADLEDELGDGAVEIARIVPQLRRRFRAVADVGESDTEPARVRLFDHFTGFLRLASATQPLVIVLDDLQWADVPSLRLLEFVAREIADSPIAILGTYRDTDIGPGSRVSHSLGALTREPVTVRLVLSGLDAGECARVVDRIAGVEVSPRVAAAIHARTNGNPLYICEIVRWLASEGSLAAAEDSQMWTRSVPAGLAQVIGRRLEPLGADAGAVLEVAALIGPLFDLDTLCAVCVRVSTVGAGDVAAHLDRAAAAGLVGAGSDGAGQLAFTHALIADVVRSRIGPIRRRQLHAEIVAQLEGSGAVSADRLAALAWHASEAGPGYAARAYRYACRAGDAAAERGAFEDAARFYEAALRTVVAGDVGMASERIHLLEALANARRAAGSLSESRPLYAEVAGEALRTGAHDRLTRAVLALAHVVPEYGRSDPNTSLWLDTALRHVGNGDPVLRSRLLARSAMELWSVDYHRAGAMAREALDLALRANDANAIAYAYYARFGGDLDIDRAAAGAAMLAAGERAGDLELIAEARIQRLRSFLEVGDAGAVGVEIVALQDLAGRSRRPRHQWLAQMSQASWLITQGQFDAGEETALRAQRFGERAEEPNAAQILAAQVAQIRDRQGRLEEIMPVVEAVVAERGEVPAWRAGLAYGYARLGRMEEASAAFAAIMDRDEVLARRDNSWMVMMHYLACAAGEIGDRRRAAVVYGLLQPYSGRNIVDDNSCYGPADYALARLALVLDDAAAAARHFEGALRVSRSTLAFPALAEAQAEYGAWLARDGGDAERAGDLLRAAHRTADRLGMHALAARTAAAIPVSAPGSAATEAEDVTATSDRPTFRRDGDFWTLTYRGTLSRVRNSKGLHYLAMLLREPGREWHVTDFVAQAALAANDRAAEGLHASRLDSQAVADARAITDYRRRLVEAEAELAEADACHDLGRKERLQQEIEMLLDHLKERMRAHRHPHASGGLETMRNTVTKTLRRQLVTIQREHPALGHHLLCAVRIGMWCSYRPETIIHWDLGTDQGT